MNKRAISVKPIHGTHYGTNPTNTMKYADLELNIFVTVQYLLPLLDLCVASFLRQTMNNVELHAFWSVIRVAKQVFFAHRTYACLTVVASFPNFRSFARFMLTVEAVLLVTPILQ